MEYVIAIGISLGLAAIIAFFWVRGIDNMQKNYPDYKGEDFLNWNNEEIDDEFSRQSKQNNKKNFQNELPEGETELDYVNPEELKPKRKKTSNQKNKIK